MEEINIKKYLKSYVQGEEVYYYPNPGNAGDALIACATFQIFSDLGVFYRIWDEQESDPQGRILFYGGGGNLISYYNQGAKIIERLHRKVKKLIILPHTIDQHANLLKSFGNNVDIICRERASFDYVKNISSKANVMLADDLAFNLNLKEVLSKDSDSLLKTLLLEFGYLLRSSHERRLSSPTLKELKFSLGKEIELFRLRNNNTLNCFRQDLEKTQIKLPDDNIDLSRLLTYKKAINQVNAFWSSNQLLRFINRFAKVRTNRLHIAIAGALLDKEVHFYKGSYYKNEAVYRYSMEKRFPNVQYMS